MEHITANLELLLIEGAVIIWNVIVSLCRHNSQHDDWSCSETPPQMDVETPNKDKQRFKFVCAFVQKQRIMSGNHALGDPGGSKPKKAFENMFHSNGSLFTKFCRCKPFAFDPTSSISTLKEGILGSSVIRLTVAVKATLTSISHHEWWNSTFLNRQGDCQCEE